MYVNNLIPKEIENILNILFRILINFIKKEPVVDVNGKR